MNDGRRRVVVAGAGAAGFFGAIACAQSPSRPDVTLLEATAHTLAKVRISGGGRCNVTRDCPDPREMARGYPRGSRELLGPLTRFGTADTVAWFRSRGVELKTEADGRMFPVTDDSATIANCLLRAASEAGVRLRTGCGLRALLRASGGLRAELTTGEEIEADRVLIATGGTRGSAGLGVAQSLGHSVTETVPSLFTFHVDDPRIRGLEGLACPAAASVPGTKLFEEGPVLVTHWGLSGPGILRLSAWGARELHQSGYRFVVRINWAAPRTAEVARSQLEVARTSEARKQVANANPLGIPARLWERLVAAAGVAPAALWGGASNDAIRALALQATTCDLQVAGKSMNKEEFVTCGGVSLAEINMATMESRLCPGLYFAGEILDIDGITGGYNFQSAWTTGWQAGRSMAD
ncbi:MAG TPA: NAD(P)/FAD-dependent oxidoreductase [Opitutaceae bacterium]